MTSLAHEYLSLEPLQTRIETHRNYSQKHDDVEQAVIDAAEIAPPDALVDVGCGTGSFLARLARNGHLGRLTGVDTSPAAVEALVGVDGVEAVLGDATALPFADGEFDLVTARHMLYHVPDLDAALREARRVLRTGGRFAAVVNHANATPNVAELVRSNVVKLGVEPPPLPIKQVHSDNLPPRVEAVFGNVEVHRFDNALVFPDADPLVRYAVALLAFYGVDVDAPERPAAVDAIVAEATSWFETHDGPWRDPKGYVVCVARRAEAQP